MPFQSVPNAVECVIQGVIGSQAIANVMGFQFAGPYGQTDLDALAGVVDALVDSEYLPLVSSGVSYVQTKVRGLTSIIDLESVNTTGAGPGTAAGTGIPANNTFCVTARTGKTGRSARGRFYAWPTIAGNYSAPSILNAGYVTAMEAFLLDVRSAAASVNWVNCVISRFSLGTARAVGITTPIINWAARNNIGDSQRHRLPRGH